MSSNIRQLEMNNVDGSEQSNSTGSEYELTQSASRLLVEAIKTRVISEIRLDLEPMLENLVRKVVNEEFKKMVPAYVQRKKIESPVSSNLSLKFVKKISLPVYTGEPIRGEGDTMIELALVNECTSEIVKSGTQASAKVEIVPLEGNFGEGKGDWTSEEFSSNILMEKDTNKSLLTGGDLELNEGIGYVQCVKFQNGSKWTKKSTIKLGARVINNFNDRIRVKEALTESFTLMDFRLKYPRKHKKRYILSPSHAVSHLRHINEDSEAYQRLCDEKVVTIEDFLILHFKDSVRLKSVLNFQPKMWKETVKQAQKCKSLKRMVWYTIPGKNRGVVFDILGTLLGMVFERQFISVENLSENYKADAHELVKSARKSWDTVVSFANEASFLKEFSCETTSVDPPSSLNQSLAGNHDSVVGEQDFNQLDYTSQGITSSANANATGGIEHEEALGIPIMEEMEVEAGCSCPRSILPRADFADVASFLKEFPHETTYVDPPSPLNPSLVGDHDSVVGEWNFEPLDYTSQGITSSANATGGIDHEEGLGAPSIGEMGVEAGCDSPISVLPDADLEEWVNELLIDDFQFRNLRGWKVLTMVFRFLIRIYSSQRTMASNGIHYSKKQKCS